MSHNNYHHHLHGQHGNIPTLTTPTLTPTTLRNIEQSLGQGVMTPPSPPYPDSAGSFVPPLPQQSNTSVNWHGGRILHSYDDDNDSVVDIKPVILPAATATKGKRGGKRATGGRRPGKNSNLSPEEDERRRMRRERNKMAAARCRKRRVDHTNMLQEETDSLESIKRSITSQITDLQHEKDELELILQAHIINCRNTKLRRPNTLPVNPIPAPTSNSIANSTPQQHQQILQTPSSGLNFTDFDWTSFPSTGLTPITGGSLTPLMTPNTVGAILGGLVKDERNDNDMAVL